MTTQLPARFEREMEAVGRLDHPNLVWARTRGGPPRRTHLAMGSSRSHASLVRRGACPSPTPARWCGRRRWTRERARPRPGPPRRQAVQPDGHAGRQGEGARPGAGPARGAEQDDELTGEQGLDGHRRLHGPDRGRTLTAWTPGPDRVQPSATLYRC